MSERQQHLQDTLDALRKRLKIARTDIGHAENEARDASFRILAIKAVAHQNGIKLDEPL